MSLVLVTGASRGIGRAVVRHAIADGHRVVGLARDAGALADLAQELGGGFVPLVADLGDREGREGLLDRVIHAAGAVPEAFVSVAGNVDYREALAVDAAAIDAHHELHLVAAFELVRALAERWVAEGVEGSVVAVSSTLATRPAPFTLPYAMAKAALDAMVRGLALELAPHAIRVNAVSPGVIDTAMVRGVRPDGLVDDAEGRLAELARLHPIGRLGQPDEVAETILHVLGARFMTGSIVVLDGGLSLV